MPLILRPMTARDPHEPHRVSTQLELFFDLVAVIAIAAITEAFHHSLSEGHGVEMLGNFAFLFVATWWAWMNHAWFASAFDNDDTVYRLLTILVMAGFLTFAGGAASIFQTLDFRYGVAGWIIMRVGMMGLWYRAARHEPRLAATAMRYFWGIGLAQVLWTSLYFATEPGSTAFLTGSLFIFLCEFTVPALAERRGVTPWHRHHIIERYGLMNIIVLGEVLLSTSLILGTFYRDVPEADLIIAAMSALVITFSLWWIYFIEADHLTSRDYGRAFVWGYGHVVIFASGALLGAGIAAYADVLTEHAHVDARTALLYVNGPVAAYLAALWLVRDRYHALGARQLVLPAAAFALVLAGLAGAPIWLTASMCMATLMLRNPGEPAGGARPGH